MLQPRQPDGQSRRQLTNRLNQLVGELNAFLLVIVIGLAALDLSCFAALHVSAEATRAQAATQTTLAGALVPGGAVHAGIKMLSAGSADR